MKMCFLSVPVLLAIPSLDSVSYGLEIGAFTLFGCDAEGTQDGHARWTGFSKNSDVLQLV